MLLGIRFGVLLWHMMVALLINVLVPPFSMANVVICVIVMNILYLFLTKPAQAT